MWEHSSFWGYSPHLSTDFQMAAFKKLKIIAYRFIQVLKRYMKEKTRHKLMLKLKALI